MIFISSEFHFLRPLWLLAMIPSLALFWALRRKIAANSGWSGIVDRSLLPHLLDSESSGKRGLLWYVLLTAWLLACTAMAGPAWEKLPQPVHKKADALVIIQDLSLSMLATDLSPNRLTRAKRKLLDILGSRHEGTTGLVVYSGDAHVVAPLTDDTNTISAMVPDLSPTIMPAYGSNLASAVSLAVKLLKDGATGEGKLLLITDDVEKKEIEEVADLLTGRDISLSVLGIGTLDGAPIPKGDGGFLTGNQGEIIVPKFYRENLRELAQSNTGRYSDIRLDDTDMEFLLAENALPQKDAQFKRIEREFDQWRDEGYWLVLAILPLALLAFRRGWLLGITILIILPATDAKAFDWQDLWLRKDQQAIRALENNKPEKASELFDDPQWKGVADFRAGAFEKAEENFKTVEGDEGNYNRGNALARQGRLDEAINAYEEELRENPEHEDARFNKELLEKLKSRQNQKGEDGQDQNKNPSKDQQGDKEDQSRNQKNIDRQGEDQGQSQQQKKDDQQKSGGEGEAKENQSADGKSESTENRQKEDTSEKQADHLDDKKDQADTDEKQRADRTEEKEDNSSDKNKTESISEEDRMTTEEQQALEQWLRRIPDNPGGLLKRKFEYQYQQNRKSNPDNNQRKIW